jgi:Amt family ammonium transporter
VAALATGISRFEQVLVQLKGILATGVFTFVGSLAVWTVVKLVMGVRVSEEEELEGLDVGEHGMSAYPDFATHPSGYAGVAPAAAPATRPLAVGQTQVPVQR